MILKLSIEKVEQVQGKTLQPYWKSDMMKVTVRNAEGVEGTMIALPHAICERYEGIYCEAYVTESKGYLWINEVRKVLAGKLKKDHARIAQLRLDLKKAQEDREALFRGGTHQPSQKSLDSADEHIAAICTILAGLNSDGYKD